MEDLITAHYTSILVRRKFPFHSRVLPERVDAVTVSSEGSRGAAEACRVRNASSWCSNGGQEPARRLQ